MKKTLFILSLFVFAIMANAQETTPAEENPNGAEITFEKIVHDYKTLNKGGDGNSQFKFTNTGNEPLILSNVRSSCGCTVPSWPREPILPGKSEVIKVKYNTSRVGTINKSITVQSNGKTATIVLKIKGKVIEPPPEQMPEKKIEDGAAPVAR